MASRSAIRKQPTRKCVRKAKTEPFKFSTINPESRYMEEQTMKDEAVCWICLNGKDDDNAEKLHRCCACRGTSGYVHIGCVIELNKHKTKDYQKCNICKQNYYGKINYDSSFARAEPVMHKPEMLLSAADIVSLFNYASACSDEKKFELATSIFEKVHRYQLRCSPSDNPSSCSVESNIANILQLQGKYDEALKIWHRIYPLFDGSVNGNYICNNIAVTHLYQRKYKKAIAAFRIISKLHRAVRVFRILDVARTNSNLAEALALCGEFAEANELMCECDTIFERELGSMHPLTIDNKHRYAAINLEMKNFDVSIRIYENILPHVYEIATWHPIVVKCIIGFLIKSYIESRQMSKARATYQTHEELFLRVLPDEIRGKHDKWVDFNGLKNVD